MDVERRTLGFTGISLPPLGLSASQPFNVIGKESQSSRASLVRAAIDRGIDLFSTSPDFGEAERILAAGLIGYRHRALVMSTIRTEDITVSYRQIDMSLHLFDGRVDLIVAGSQALSDELLTSVSRMRSSGEASAIGIECQSLEALRSIAPIVTAEGIDLLSISSALLLNPETPQLLTKTLPPQCGVVAYVPDGMEGVASPGLDDLKLNVAGHGLRTLGDVLLKLATSDPRIMSVTIPARRIRDLDRFEDIVYSPPLSESEMAALRTG
ncbi:MAG: hypothetical protein R3A46_05700 [Thermomicrobiales bacterium]